MKKILSPIIWFTNLCVLTALTTINKYHIDQINVSTISLYDNLKEVIYIEQPQGLYNLNMNIKFVIYLSPCMNSSKLLKISMTILHNI